MNKDTLFEEVNLKDVSLVNMKNVLITFTLMFAGLLTGCDNFERQSEPSSEEIFTWQTEAILPSASPEKSKMGYWEERKRIGANSFNYKPPSQAYFDAFADYGGEWVRLTWTKWDSASSGTFLIGDPSNYRGLIEEDVIALKGVVSRARNSGVKVVFTPLTLPGAVWNQHNNDQIDDRLYSDKTYWEQSAAFWRDLAAVFKDDSTVIAYNIINEPTPERSSGYESGTLEENIEWYEQQIGTPRDLPAFYEYVVDAIRNEDAETPIMIDGGFFGNPNGFGYFPRPLKDNKTLYAFHMYQPWAATSVSNVRNGSKLVYPGKMEYWGRTENWDAERVQQTIQQPLDWADEHGIKRSHMVMSEFGCHRYLKWCSTYMEDVLTAADTYSLHWAFYTFRSDSWGGMDYELGSEAPSKKSMGVTAEEFWELSGENRLDELPRSNTSVFEPISKRLQSNLEILGE